MAGVPGAVATRVPERPVRGVAVDCSCGDASHPGSALPPPRPLFKASLNGNSSGKQLVLGAPGAHLTAVATPASGASLYFCVSDPACGNTEQQVRGGCHTVNGRVNHRAGVASR